MTAHCTATGTDVAEERVRCDLDLILSGILENLPAGSVVCVALIGGFGRGEGGVVAAPGGDVVAFNDYDLMVVTRGPVQAAAVRQIAPALAATVGVDFVDIGLVAREALPRVPSTVFWYELRAGHQVLFGDPEALKAIPPIDPATLPIIEGTRLLTNRGMSLLWAWLHIEESVRQGTQLDEARFRFSINSIHKAVLAVGDAALILAGRYDISYRERAVRVPGVELPFSGREREEFVAAHAAAMQFKLYPDLTPVPSDELVRFWDRVCGWHETALRWIEETRLDRPVGAWRNYPARLAAEALTESLRHPRRYLRERRTAPRIRGWSRLFLDIERSHRARLPFLLYSASAEGLDCSLLRSGLAGVPEAPLPAREMWRNASFELLAEWHP